VSELALSAKLPFMLRAFALLSEKLQKLNVEENNFSLPK
jgi:hypothetical protein